MGSRAYSLNLSFVQRGGYVRDEVVPVLLLLETAEGHLGARDVLLGVLEVVELQSQLLASSGTKLKLSRHPSLTRPVQGR